MEKKKAAKKTAAKKKLVGPKSAETRSPWTEVAVELPAPEEIATVSVAKKKSLKKKAAKPNAVPATSSKAKKAPTAAAEPKAKTTPKKAARKITKKPTLDVTAEIAVAEPQVELSPVFTTLAAPTLPELQRENRARLMMQTPTRAYFYWSVRENPYQLLRRAFGDDLGSYTLVLKLTELKRGVEKIHHVEPEGNWWFDIEPDGRYEAEIGFYAPNRPYFRVLYSNTVETPRRSPSARVASDMDWRVSATKFAEVLDVAGFSQDAFDVAMAGDDHEAAEHVTHQAFSRFIGNGQHDLRGIAAEDIRYSLMALASGSKIEELRSRISPSLFAILQANAERVAAGNAASVLTEYFDIDETEFTEQQYGSAVYGASRVHFPRSLKARVPKYSPVGSHSYR